LRKPLKGRMPAKGKKGDPYHKRPGSGNCPKEKNDKDRLRVYIDANREIHRAVHMVGGRRDFLEGRCV